MRVFVIRHGQSETNLQKLWTGWQDIPLTEQGRQDAKKAGEFLKNIPLDKIYASDLSRARETAEIAVPGCRYEVSPLLREINVGSLAYKPFSYLTDEQKKRCSQYGYIDFDGETQTAFHDRIRSFQKQLEALDAENVAVFSHGGWVRGMLDTVMDTCLPKKHLRCNNCMVAIFEYENNQWFLHSWINSL